jgi:3-oxoadipate enol-lactonase
MASILSLPDSRHLSYSLDTEPKDAPVVILSNSLCAPFTVWDHVVRVLNKSGYRTLRYDQPGHGDSSAPKALDTTFVSIADDIGYLLKTLGISKVHSWIGVSMGAATGIYFVTQYPNVVSKLAICDTINCSPSNAGVDDAFGPRVAAARKDGNMENTIRGSLERWFGKEWQGQNPHEAERMRSLMLRTSLDGFETCCNALRSDSFDLRPLLGKVGASVEEAICVVGEKDANLPETMADMRAKVEEGFSAAGKPKSVDLAVIKNAGHVCFIDGFDQFNEVILSFLKK